MADTTTPIYGFLLQETGGNPNAWGANLNNLVITPIENALGGVATISGLSGGSYTLLQPTSIFATIKLQGNLTSDLTITAPSQPNEWTFINQCTGNFYVLIKTAAGTAVNIPRGCTLKVTCDGSAMFRHDKDRVGELFYHAGTVVPPGALECTGATPLRASLPDLYTAIGTTWGVGNGTTTFTLPDSFTAGKFLRSRTASVTVGTSQTDQNKAHTHTGSGTTASGGVDHQHSFAGTTSGQSQSHTHTEEGSQPFGNSGGGSGINGAPQSKQTGAASVDHTHTFSGATGTATAFAHTHTYSFTTSSDGGTEARPTNLTAMLCVRY